MKYKKSHISVLCCSVTSVDGKESKWKAILQIIFKDGETAESNPIE